AAAERLNRAFDGRSAAEMQARTGQFEGQDLEMDVARLVIDTIRTADARDFSEIYRDGVANLLDDVGTRQAVRVLEERTLLADVLSQVTEPAATGVQVIIGGE